MQLLKSHNILYFVSCLFILSLSILQNKFENIYFGTLLYVVFNLCFGLMTFFLIKKYHLKPLKKSVFIISSLMLIGTNPLFENDHYRYLWEGKILKLGKSPYLYPPKSLTLKDISFEKKEKIGFKHLSSPYPPFALIYFSLAPFKDFKHNLHFFQIINIFLLGIIIFFLQKHQRLNFLAMLYPIISKEMINSIHIDGLFAFLIFFSLIKNSFSKNFFYFFLGLYTKIVNIILYPIFILKLISIKKIIINISLFSFGIILLIYTMDFSGHSGLINFSKDWIWAPGFINIIRGFIPLKTSKIISAVVFIIFLFIIYLPLIKRKIKNDDIKNHEYLQVAFFALTTLLYFSPTYNSWYSLIYVFLASFIKNKTGIIYALFSSAAYLLWEYEYAQLIGIIIHIPYYFISVQIFKNFYSASLLSSSESSSSSSISD